MVHSRQLNYFPRSCFKVQSKHKGPSLKVCHDWDLNPYPLYKKQVHFHYTIQPTIPGRYLMTDHLGLIPTLLPILLSGGIWLWLTSLLDVLHTKKLFISSFRAELWHWSLLSALEVIFTRHSAIVNNSVIVFLWALKPDRLLPDCYSHCIRGHQHDVEPLSTFPCGVVGCLLLSVAF